MLRSQIPKCALLAGLLVIFSNRGRSGRVIGLRSQRRKSEAQTYNASIWIKGFNLIRDITFGNT
jgi:hypothetical protein